METVPSVQREIKELELALLRRGVEERGEGHERCARCRRLPLIGERVYVYAQGRVLCELCRRRQRTPPLESRTVHTPAFGHSIRILDQRAA
jgi:hypothetical protein